MSTILYALSISFCQVYVERLLLVSYSSIMYFPVHGKKNAIVHISSVIRNYEGETGC